MRNYTSITFVILLLGGCKGPAAAPAASAPVDSTQGATAPRTVVDSALPRQELLRRFRVDLPEVGGFTGGAPSRKALGQLIVTALEHRDTAQLRALAVTRAEFAWLYYPTSAQGLPPYDLSPGLYWFMLDQRSARGMRWLLQNRGGTPLHYAGMDCGKVSNVEGANTSWGPCRVREVRAPGDTIAERFASIIVERGGKYKVLAYDGDRD